MHKIKLMTIGLIIFFVLLGLLFLVIEILVTPGIVLGIVGLGFITFGVYQSYAAFGNTTGNIVLFSSGLGTIGMVLFAMKSGVWSRMASKESITSRAKENVESLTVVGATGKALSALRPSGTALIDGRKIEVVTEGEIVEAGTSLEVIRITQNKIYIKKI